MANYVKATDFTAKDALSSGDSAKLIKGSLFDTEFDEIAARSAEKYDSDDLASQAEAQAESSNIVLMTPLRVANWADNNLGLVGDLQALSSDPSADRIIFFDDTDNTVKFLTPGDGIEINGTNLQLPSGLAGNGLALASGVLSVNVGEGIKLESDTVRLVDVAAGSAQPVVVANGTFTYDLSSITTISGTGINQAVDAFLISDNGVLKVLPIDEMGIGVQTRSTAQTFTITDGNTMQVLTGSTNRVWTLPPNSSVAYEIGTIIICQNSGTGNLSITAAANVIMDSIFHTAGSAAQTDVVEDGGTAVLIKTASDTWALSGDIRDVA